MTNEVPTITCPPGCEARHGGRDRHGLAVEDGRVLVTHDRAFGDVVAVSVTEVFAAGPATADRFVEVRATIDGEFVSRDLARLTDARDALVEAVAWASDFAAGIRAKGGSE